MTFQGNDFFKTVNDVDSSSTILVSVTEVPVHYRYPEDYIHRVGRTARVGRGGLALSFITQVKSKIRCVYFHDFVEF